MHTKTAAVDLALRHLAGQPMTRQEVMAMRGARRVGGVMGIELDAASLRA